MGLPGPSDDAVPISVYIIRSQPSVLLKIRVLILPQASSDIDVS